MAAGNERITFPTNYYYGSKMKWRPLLDKLKEIEEKRDAANAQNGLLGHTNAESQLNINGLNQSGLYKSASSKQSIEKDEFQARNLEDYLFDNIKMENIMPTIQSPTKHN